MDFGRPPRPRRSGTASPGSAVEPAAVEAEAKGQTGHVVRVGGTVAHSRANSPRGRSIEGCESGPAGERPSSSRVPPKFADAGPLGELSVEELRERLTGMQRRLGKEGVRVASLEAALGKERKQNAELTAELAAARSVQRDRGRLYNPSGLGGIGDGLDPSEDAARRATELHAEKQRLVAELAAQEEHLASGIKQGVHEQLQAAREKQKMSERARIEQFENSEQERAAKHLASELAEHDAHWRASEREQDRKREVACEELVSSEAACLELEAKELRLSEEIDRLAGKLAEEVRSRTMEAEDELDRRLVEMQLDLHADFDRRMSEARQNFESELAEVGSRAIGDAEAQFREKLQSELCQQEACLQNIIQEGEASARADRGELEEELTRHREHTKSQKLVLNELKDELHEELECAKRERAINAEIVQRREKLEAELSRQRALLTSEQAARQHLETDRDTLMSELADARSQHRSAERERAELSDGAEKRACEFEDRVGREERLMVEAEAAADEARAEHVACCSRLREAESTAEAVAESRLQEALEQHKSREDRFNAMQSEKLSEVARLHAEIEESKRRVRPQQVTIEVQTIQDEASPAAGKRQATSSVAIENAQLRKQLVEAQTMLEQLQMDLENAQQELNRRQKAEGGEANLDELQWLLRKAYEENKQLREQISQQREEIEGLERNVLGALDDIRDDENTGRRWGVSGGLLGDRRIAPRARSLGSKSDASGRSTPPRKPGDIRKVPAPKGGGRTSGFVKIPDAL